MNQKESLLCAQVSQFAYGKEFPIEGFSLKARFENKGTDTQGVFGEAYGNTLVIAFRGSEETGPEDWITDLKFFKQVFPYGEDKNSKVRVHYGFIQAYKSVREGVLDWAKKSPLKRVICTGHSLGAALATLCALDIQYNLPDKEIFCYTFGSPKVGNSEFAASFNKRVPNTYRFVNADDVVPATPPGSYEHVGILRKIGTDSSKIQEIAKKIEAHFPHNYIKGLQSLK